MKTIAVSYYAVLREQRGLSRESVHTDAATAAELYDELRARHGFTLESRLVKVAVNGAFQPLDIELKGGEDLVFIPPVAGG